MAIKTREIKNILEPMEDQVKKLGRLNSCKNATCGTETRSAIIDQLKTLSDKLDHLTKENTLDYLEMKSNITRVVEEFSSLQTTEKSVENVDKETLEQTLSSAFDKFQLALEALEKLGCLPLKQRLLDCWDYVNDMGQANGIEHFQNIKELGNSLLELVEPLQRYGRSLVSSLLSEKIALYTCQLYTSFKLLVRLVQEQHRLNAAIYTCKKYVCERLCFCFKMIIEVLDVPNPSTEDEISARENHFVYRMDLALDIISEMSKNIQQQKPTECEELWLTIEDIFSHAMAIAQVCKPYNFKAITGAFQSIISEYENLKQQIASEVPDPALNNLFASTLNDALYRLERKVNVAMLNLVMEVFSDPFSALRKLVACCGNSLRAKDRSKSDLTNVIEDFDQLIDQTVQICLFTIASCTDKNRIIQIRNSLAGMESLETELVSAILAFYLHPDNKEMRASVKILTEQWQSDINKLHDTIDLIIDSGAYCEVVLDDLVERIAIMTDCLDNREPVTQIQVQAVVQRALALSKQISATINDIGNDVIERQTIMMVRELKAAIFEADSASKSILSENATEPQQLRVIKRCELIANVVKRLQPALVTIMNNTSSVNSNYEKLAKGQGDGIRAPALILPDRNHGSSLAMYQSPHAEKTLTYIRTPYTVKHYKSPLSIQPPNSVTRSELDLSCLIPYIKKGREMRTEWSIMYKTPKKNSSIDSVHSKKSPQKRKLRFSGNVRQHLFSRDSITSTDGIRLYDETMDLTEILEKFVSSSTTLSSTSTTIHSQKNQSVSIVTPGNNNESSTIGAGDGPSIIDVQATDNKNEII